MSPMMRAQRLSMRSLAGLAASLLTASSASAQGYRVVDLDPAFETGRINMVR